MGKRIIQRARGKGGPRYRAPSHRYAGKVEYYLSKSISSGQVIDIIHDQGRNSPLAIVKFPNGVQKLHIAPEGIKVGDSMKYWEGLGLGSVLPLGKIPEGMRIFSIETNPGSGPKLCRSSGSFATIMSKIKDKVRISFPSGKIREMNGNCLATVGTPAGSGRREKPWVKAGTRFIVSRKRGRLYPIVSGVAMGPVNHPFGGKTKPGIPKSVSRHAPPGRKVGAISPRRMGKRKK
ncbi:MAG: 50S ribosomal protein L2 [Candidatus Aenigmarchaeota archaeon]|nr:50S ribosomal protein L2 [Candidatus Aenigmarchaeota archaeon]